MTDGVGAAGASGLFHMVKPQPNAAHEVQQQVEQLNKDQKLEISDDSKVSNVDDNRIDNYVSNVDILPDGAVQFLTLMYLSDGSSISQSEGTGGDDNQDNGMIDPVKLSMAHELYNAAASLSGGNNGDVPGLGGSSGLGGGDSGGFSGAGGGSAGGAGGGGITI